MMPRALSVFLWAFCVSVVSVWADELPLPKDVASLEAPYMLDMGTRRVRAQGFVTKLAPDKARAFYEDALVKQGWKLGTPPWAVSMQGKSPEQVED